MLVTDRKNTEFAIM